MKLLICCPNWRHLGLECHRGLLQVAAAMTPDPEGWGVGKLLWGGIEYELDFVYAVHTNIPFAREYLVDAALERHADLSVHVDADTGFELEHLMGLVELIGVKDDDEEPITGAGAPIALRHPPHNIAAFPLPMTQTMPSDWWKLKAGQVVEVAASGMGLFAFDVGQVAMINRPLFPVFDNRFGARACPVVDLPLWLTNETAKIVGSDVGFTARLADLGRVVIDCRPYESPVRHIVECTLAPFETTLIQGGPGAGKRTR